MDGRTRRIALSLSLVFASAGGLEWARLNARLTTLERRPIADPGYLSQLDARQARSEATLEELVDAASDREERLYQRLAGLDRSVHEARDGQSQLVDRIGLLESTADEPAGMRVEIEALSSLLEEREAQIAALQRTAAETARVHRERLDELQRQLEDGRQGVDPDPTVLWRELVGPSVQISGDETVGSGVLLRSERLADGRYRTNVLTAWHVVRDLYPLSDDREANIPVKIYDPTGRYRIEHAKLVARDAEIDVALLELETEQAFENGVRLAPRERLNAMRVFDPIYAVGCPLGNDPIPTRGELASTAHAIDGETYWMISAPTYIGNSGGGVFNARTNELVGIFSKIYTHGTMRSTIVPHMGLATPLSTIYDWLAGEGYAGVFTPSEDADVRTAAVNR